MTPVSIEAKKPSLESLPTFEVITAVALSPTNLATSAPQLISPSFFGGTLVAGNLATTAPQISTVAAVFSGVYPFALREDTFIELREIGDFALREGGPEGFTFLATNLSVAAPQLGVGVSAGILSAAGLTVAAPQLGVSTVTKLISALNLLTTPPQLGTATISPPTALSAVNLLTASPQLAPPPVEMGKIFATTNIETSSPQLTAATLGQIEYIFISVNLSTSAPEIIQFIPQPPALVAAAEIRMRRVIVKRRDAVDIRIKQYPSLDVTMDWVLRDSGELDDREELATAVRVALGTNRLADEDIILPDPDSTDRQGWWGDMDAEVIWDGWPVGCKNWVLTRSKITDAPSAEGSTLERARQYTLEALQPFIDKGVCSRVDVEAKRTELQRIEVHAMIYRGPLLEIDLKYQIFWGDSMEAFGG